MTDDPRSEKPLVTFALFAFNQERFIREALQGAFAQTYEPLEIILSDDCSSDRTFEIMQEEAEKYVGPHTIRLNRNERNLGIIGHVNRMFELSDGVIIITAAGDDISYPFRTERIVNKFKEDNPLLVHSEAHEINLDGIKTGRPQPDVNLFKKTSIEKAAFASALYLGATAGWSKELYSIFGPLKYNNAWEDLTLGFRAIIENRFASIREPLIKYRFGSGLSTIAQKTHSFKQLWNQKKFHLKKKYDVLRQRRDDYALSENYDDAIYKKLETKIASIRHRLTFYERPQSDSTFSVASRFITPIIYFFEALCLVCKWLRELYKNAIPRK